MGIDKIHLHFVFNRINYYAPFFQQSVARMIRTGDHVPKNIIHTSKDTDGKAAWEVKHQCWAEAGQYVHGLCSKNSLENTFDLWGQSNI